MQANLKRLNSRRCAQTAARKEGVASGVTSAGKHAVFTTGKHARRLENRGKSAKIEPEGLQNGVPKCLGSPSGTQMHPRSAQEPPKSPPGSAKERPRSAPGAPKGPQDPPGEPKRAPRRLRERVRATKMQPKSADFVVRVRPLTSGGESLLSPLPPSL